MEIFDKINDSYLIYSHEGEINSVFAPREDYVHEGSILILLFGFCKTRLEQRIVKGNIEYRRL